MSAIKIKNITKSWGDFTALDTINFECEEGTLLVLLGPSGCGKSTTLRMIAGLETPTAGVIEIGAKDVTHLPPVKRGISMVFQNYALFPHLSVGENILFGLKARKISKSEQKKQLEYAADILGLAQYLDRKPAQLSGGQRQRVALGRAIVAKSSVCLMDEPLSNLDAKLRQEMRQEIRSLQQRLKMTMVYVTHDQVEAMTIADKIILMKGGGIEQHGTPEELYNRPQTAFTGNFIGNPPMNILEMDQALKRSFGSVLPDENSVEPYQLGIRPENIEISENAGLAVKVETIEYLGSETLLLCRSADQQITVAVNGRASARVGDQIKLHWKSEHIHLFSLATGQRLESWVKG